MSDRSFDTYKTLLVLDPHTDQYDLLRREQCTPYEWSCLVEEAQNSAWWDRWFHRRPPLEAATLSLCYACEEFRGVETTGTTEQRLRSRCLACGAHSWHDVALGDGGVEH